MHDYVAVADSVFSGARQGAVTHNSGSASSAKRPSKVEKSMDVEP